MRPELGYAETAKARYETILAYCARRVYGQDRMPGWWVVNRYRGGLRLYGAELYWY